MFTVPVTLLASTLTSVWPTANTIVAGSVTNPANAYDQGPTTYAAMDVNTTFSVQAWGAVTPATATLTINQVGTVSGGGGTGSVSAYVSYNNGTTYTDTAFTTTGEVPGTVNFVLQPYVDLSQVRIKFVTKSSGGVTATLNIYDVHITY